MLTRVFSLSAWQCLIRDLGNLHHIDLLLQQDARKTEQIEQLLQQDARKTEQIEQLQTELHRCQHQLAAVRSNFAKQIHYEVQSLQQRIDQQAFDRQINTLAQIDSASGTDIAPQSQPTETAEDAPANSSE
ncbi:MAG: hypothetical protein DRH08_05920 [Deltaproteobacteria bacterium]|nr:MAG: hypothetical protein DRH08_05920 [Deltaproteobacteria bacterium]